MAHQRIYKNIAVRDESTWGVSASGTNQVIKIRTTSLGLNPNKALVEETNTSIKGRDRITLGRNEIDGDISAYATPRNLHHMLEWVTGVQGSSASSGDSMMAVMTYNQNTSGNYLSKTVVLDRNNTQEAFYGVRASKLTLNWANDLVESVLTTMAKTRSTGPSLSDVVGETVKPFEFADVTVSVGGPGFTSAATLLTSNGSIEYDNGQERTFLSGSRDASRMDGNIPTISGSFEIFHEGLSYVSPTYGCSELYVRVEASTVSCQGLINGITPYYLRINIPRVEFTSNVRNYEQAALSIETIEFMGKFDAGTSALFTATLNCGTDIES